jgi:hypothetical protein
MTRILMAAYAAGGVLFCVATSSGPRVAGLIVSLLWPIALALTLAWLIMLNDDALNV